MKRFKSFLKPKLESFESFRKGGDRWNDTYHNLLAGFDNYIYEEFSEADSITQEMVNQWCHKRPTESLSTKAKRVYPLAHFIEHGNERDWFDIQIPDIPSTVSTPKVPHPFTQQELKSFFYECDHMKSRSNSQLVNQVCELTIPVFFRTLYCTGMRPCEALRLERSDVNFQSASIEIRNGKGGHQRILPIHEELNHILKTFDAEANHLFPDRKYFFTSSERKETHFKSAWVNYNFRKLWKNTGSQEYAVPYDFRHNFVIQNINKWIGDTLDFHDKLLYLSKYMGHASVEETKYYYSLVPALSNIISNTSDETESFLIPEVYDEKKF